MGRMITSGETQHQWEGDIFNELSPPYPHLED